MSKEKDRKYCRMCQLEENTGGDSYFISLHGICYNCFYEEREKEKTLNWDENEIPCEVLEYLGDIKKLLNGKHE